MTRDKTDVRILCIYGNPKSGGFVHSCLDHVADRLERSGAKVDRLRLADSDIRDCIGCFACLRTGKCALHDDMANVIERIRASDGMVTGASVRNGLSPAIFKRFFERITYILGFGRELRGKYVLAIGAVGYAGGRRQLGRLLTFREFQTFVSDYLFFRTGIPTSRKVDDVSQNLDRATDRFYRTIVDGERLPWLSRLVHKLDNFVVRKVLLERNPDHVYDHVIARWKEKGIR